MTSRLLLLDSASLYFRAFFGVPDTVRAADGTPVNAVRGFLDMIAKLVTTYRPTDLVACWDDSWRPQWRVDLLPSYKAHRVASGDAEEVPSALDVQVPIIREVLSALGIVRLGAPGYEADDVIGTLATRASGPVDVVTGDRDLLQLVDDDRGIRVVYTARGMSNLEDVTDDVIVAKYGVHAAQYADFATLRGDASDGLPGVSGVGEKTAATLLRDLGDLAGIVAAAAAGTGMTPRIAGKVRDAAPYLAVAPAVVAVATDVPLDVPDTSLPLLDAARAAHISELGERWNISSSLARVTAAFGG